MNFSFVTQVAAATRLTVFGIRDLAGYPKRRFAPDDHGSTSETFWHLLCCWSQLSNNPISSTQTRDPAGRPRELARPGVAPGGRQDLTAEGNEGWGLGNLALGVMQKRNFQVTVAIFRSPFCPYILPPDDRLGTGAGRPPRLGRVALFNPCRNLSGSVKSPGGSAGVDSVEKTGTVRFGYGEVMFWGVSRNLGDRVLQIRGGFGADTVGRSCDSVQCQRTALPQVWLPTVTGSELRCSAAIGVLRLPPPNGTARSPRLTVPGGTGGVSTASALITDPELLAG